MTVGICFAVTVRAECLAIIYIKPEFREICEWLDMVYFQITAFYSAPLASKVISFEYR